MLIGVMKTNETNPLFIQLTVSLNLILLSLLSYEIIT